MNTISTYVNDRLHHHHGQSPKPMSAALTLGGKKLRKQWSARRPAHDDKSSSLITFEGRTSAVRVPCMASCEPIEIIAEILWHEAWRRRGMSEIQLTRAQRRAMKKFADRVDRITQAVRLFFERFPHRQHRVRLSSQAEVGQNEIIDGKRVDLPPGWRWFTAVRNVQPGVRLRLFVPNVEGAETDLTEAVAREVFEAAATPFTWQLEARLHKAAGTQA